MLCLQTNYGLCKVPSKTAFLLNLLFGALIFSLPNSFNIILEVKRVLSYLVLSDSEFSLEPFKLLVNVNFIGLLLQQHALIKVRGALFPETSSLNLKP